MDGKVITKLPTVCQMLANICSNVEQEVVPIWFLGPRGRFGTNKLKSIEFISGGVGAPTSAVQPELGHHESSKPGRHGKCGRLLGLASLAADGGREWRG